MKEKTPSNMAQQSSSESEITKMKKPHQPKSNKTVQEQKDIDYRDQKDEEGAMITREESSGREKLKKHRVEVAGRVWIPEIWGQEDLLKDWVDCSALFDANLVPSTIFNAKEALVQQGSSITTRRATTGVEFSFL